MSVEKTSLVDYYAKHEISNIKGSFFPYRFVRLHPRYDALETVRLLKDELSASHPDIPSEFPILVPWMDVKALQFYAIPDHFSLNQSALFRNGRIYGQDVSSGAAVAALLTDHFDSHKKSTTADTKQPWHVLDLCAAPGLKLCAMADYLAEHRPNSSVVGVDISETRIAITKKILYKYHADNPEKGSHVYLFCDDGTKFGSGSSRNLVYDSDIATELGKRRRMNKSARARERKRLKASSTERYPCSSNPQFDRVLVDAECSTDGSLKHVQKKLADSDLDEGVDIIPTLTNPDELQKLVDLQRKLADSGFHLLKVGGEMVYSTCSLSEAQNESVVRWLLKSHKNAEIVTLDVLRFGGRSTMVQEGTVAGTVRLLPNIMESSTNPSSASENLPLYGGGFFLAKLRKAA